MQPKLPGFDDGPEDSIPKSAALELAEPHLAFVALAVVEGLGLYHETILTKGQEALSRSGIGHAISDFIQSRATVLLNGYAGASCRRHQQSFMVHLGDSLVIRYQHTKEDHLVRRQGTDLAKAYYADEFIDGVPEGVLRLSACYTLDRARSRVASISLTRQIGPKNLVWAEEILSLAFPVVHYYSAPEPQETPQEQVIVMKGARPAAASGE